MSKFEELLSGVDVEEISLSDKKFFLLENSKRKPVKASSRVSGVTPYYGANNVQDYVEGFTHDGEYLLIAEDGTKSVKDYSIQYVKGKLWANNHVHVISGTGLLNNRYLYHFLKSFNFIPFLTGGGRAKLTKASLFCIKIPIPCPEDLERSLAIQAEIVRILDTFTDLTAELENELVARREQFDFYRNQMFYVNNNKISGVDVKLLPLGDVTRYEQPTKYLVKSKIYNDDYKTPVLTAGKTFVLGHTDEVSGINKASKSPVIIFDDFTTASKWVDFDFKAKSSAMKMIYSSDNSKFNLKFVHYWLSSQPTAITEGDHKRHWISCFCKKQIPIPCPEEPEKSLAFQAEIVEKLDKFDALVNSVEEGLPKEIELRHKQYEYYRDMLFGLLQKEE